MVIGKAVCSLGVVFGIAYIFSPGSCLASPKGSPCDSIEKGETSASQPVSVPSMTIHTSPMMSLKAEECIVTQNLKVEDGAVIQTNGFNLSIVVLGDLDIEGSMIIQSFDVAQLESGLTKPPTPTKAGRGFRWNPSSTTRSEVQGRQGGTGTSGVQGTPGTPGLNAGSVRIYIAGNAKGKLSVLNIGSNGGPGGDGGDAGDGGTGEQGGRSTSVENNFLGSTFYTCGSGPGYGGHGGDGGVGGEAGAGGKGGNGGEVHLWIAGTTGGFEVDKLSVAAGRTGEPGIPGSGGQKGCPGYGGLGGPACSGMERIRGCDKCNGNDGTDGGVQLLQLGSDGSHNLRWFPFNKSSAPPKAEDACTQFGVGPADEDSPNEQIFDLWDQLSLGFQSLKSARASVKGGGVAYVIELNTKPTQWQNQLEQVTYSLTQTPPAQAGDCSALATRSLFGRVAQAGGLTMTPEAWAQQIKSTVGTQAPPTEECLQSLTITDRVDLINTFERLRFLFALLNLYGEELSRQSVLIDTTQFSSNVPLPLEASGLYLKWPNKSGNNQMYTKLDDVLFSRLSRTTNLLLDKIRTAIGSKNSGKDTFICSDVGFSSGRFDAAQLSPTFPSLQVSTGEPTRLFGSGVDLGFSMQIKSSDRHSYFSISDGVVAPISTGSKAFCSYYENLSKARFNSYECLGQGGSLIFDSLKNQLYHPHSSVFFYDLLYLESFFSSEGLDTFDIDAIRLITKPDCVDY